MEGWLANTASRYSSPSFLDFRSNQRALTAAWKLHGWKESGKSWRTQGMLYLVAASRRSGLARAQSGHSMSSNSTMATRAPGGGLRAAGSWTWVVGDPPPNWAWAGITARRLRAEMARAEWRR